MTMIDGFAPARERMVREQIEARGVRDPRVLAAMREVPRHRFVEISLWPHAYEDRPLSIGLEQTISQPYMVAYMVEALRLENQKILEIGTGSGYETAVLARLTDQIFSVEVEPELSARAERALREVGASGFRLRVGDGMKGWPEEAPFGRIVLTAAVDTVPFALLEQLEPGGWLLGPVGRSQQEQRLVRVQRTMEGYQAVDLMPVLFVQCHQK